MIEIIKKGVRPEDRRTIYSVTCHSCDTVFHCDDRDFYLERVQHGPRISEFKTVKCPLCDRKLYIHPNTSNCTYYIFEKIIENHNS